MSNIKYLPMGPQIIIASFLQPYVKKTKIVIKQYKPNNKPQEFHILLKNGSSREFFEKHINRIKDEIIFNKQRILKQDFSYWMGIDKNATIDKLFRANTSPNIYSDPNFIPTNEYIDKYIIHDIGCALFSKFVEEIREPSYEIIRKYFIRTQTTSEHCFDIHIKDDLKNPLRVINKIFNKYTYPKEKGIPNFK